MATWRSLAAANNAEWCDIVCRSHDLRTTFHDEAWTSSERTPPYYPDAITFVPAPSVPKLLAGIDVSPGCSVKDSFASLDLTTFGFRVLFDSEWIVRATTAPPSSAAPRWEVVSDPAAFAIWERAWRGDDGPPGVLRADLLDHGSVTVLEARVGEEVAAGAILNRSEKVVGITNFFADSRLASTAWAGCIALAGTLVPGATLVGYESGEDLDAARASGFEAAGPLRAWLHEG